MDMFADEHMVEMNRKPSVHAPRQRRHSHSLSPSPRLSKPLPSAPVPAPPVQLEQPPQANEPLNHDPGLLVSGGTDDSFELVNNNSDMVKPDVALKEVTQTNSKVEHTKKVTNDVSGKIRKLLPFASTSLPEDQVSLPVKTALDKFQQNNSRKRERTPSPTYTTTTLPNSKRPAFSSNSITNSNSVSAGVTKFTSSSLPSAAKQETKGTMSNTGSGFKLSSASQVLTEEIQKQQGQENSKLKSLIVKEVRKPGKSKSEPKASKIHNGTQHMFILFHCGCIKQLLSMLYTVWS